MNHLYRLIGRKTAILFACLLSLSFAGPARADGIEDALLERLIWVEGQEQ